MSNSFEVLQAEVLQLPKSDRSKLLDRLIESLDADDQMEAAWDAVADERERALEAGTARLIPLAEVLERLEARYKA